MSSVGKKVLVPGDTEQVNWPITGLDCPSCAAGLSAAVSGLAGVMEAEVIFAAGRIRVVYDPLETDTDQILARIRTAGHDVPGDPTGRSGSSGGMGAPAKTTAWQWVVRNRRFLAALAATTLLLAAVVIDSGPWGRWLSVGGRSIAVHIALYLAATAIGGFYVALAAARSLSARRIDMNVLMTVAVLGALAIGCWSEAATVTVLFALSLWLEERAMDRARHAIRSLLKLKPDRVRVVDDHGQEQVLAPADVPVGRRVQVRPSERIGLDGVVESGISSVNQSAVTGESAPASKGPGDEVLAGTINLEATLTIRVTRAAGESTISRIINLVEQAQATRAPAQRFVDRFARIYTPLVVGIAVLVAIGPPLLFGQPFLDPSPGAGLGGHGEHGWLYRALVLLVIACPCALVISTPVSVVSALASAARRGVLIKGGVHLETLARVHCVVFDKTGTLTRGHPVVTDVLATGPISGDDLLRIAAALESHSEHHLAHALLAKAREVLGNGNSEIPEVRVLPGRGLAGRIDGDEYWLGNQRLARERGADLSALEAKLAELESQGKTLVLIGRSSVNASSYPSPSGRGPGEGAPSYPSPLGRGQGEGSPGEIGALPPSAHCELLGLIAVADQVRPSAKAAMELLRRSSRTLHGRGGARVEGGTNSECGIRNSESKANAERETGSSSIPNSEFHIPNSEHRAHLVMLTGDNRATARSISEKLGLDSFAAELLPEEKVSQVRRLAYDCTGAVAMVGDGVNDAPALAAADVGIAMGTAGTDAALQTADIALIGDDLAGVPFAIRLGRRTRRVIAQNVWFAILLKATVLTLAVAGLANLWMAVIADMGASLAVTANGLRLLWVKR